MQAQADIAYFEGDFERQIIRFDMTRKVDINMTPSKSKIVMAKGFVHLGIVAVSTRSLGARRRRNGWRRARRRVCIPTGVAGLGA
jgi:hypothetical protein